MLDYSGGRRSVPVIVDGDEVTVGFRRRLSGVTWAAVGSHLSCSSPLLPGDNPRPYLDSLFHLTERATSIRTEVLAGVTTFSALAYIIFVSASRAQCVRDGLRGGDGGDVCLKRHSPRC